MKTSKTTRTAILLVSLFVSSALRPATASAAGNRVVAWGENNSGATDVPVGLSNVVAVAGGGRFGVALRDNGTVVAWGRNDFGQCNVPVGLSNVVAIAAGDSHAIALIADGTLRTWGRNTFGQATVPPNLSDAVAIAAGTSAHFTLALKADGTVVAFGDNPSGQCTVPSFATNVIAVSGGAGHSVALRSDGTVLVWGNYGSGQNNVPVGLNSVVSIANGNSHILALKSDGTVVAWGDNYYGQSTVPAGLSNVTAIQAPALTSLALKADGRIVGWGNNDFDQATAPAGLSNVVGIASGSSQTFAIVGDVVLLNLNALLITQPLNQNTPLGQRIQLKVTVLTTGAFQYQWYKDGEEVVGATNAVLEIASAAPSDGGFYKVRVTSGANSVTSRTVTLTVANQAPVITTQPVSQQASEGGELILSMSAYGGPTRRFIWFYNDVEIPGETNTTLRLRDVTATDTGNYKVLATNSAGFAWSQTATLTVVPLPTVGEALDALRSGAIGDGQSSWVETTVNGPGSVTFWWKASSEAGFDPLRFLTNGTEQARLSGEQDWQQRTLPIATGAQTLRWQFQKDGSSAGGQDRAWLDQVAYTPLPGVKQPVQLVPRQTYRFGQFRFTLLGQPGSSPQVQASTNLVDWEPVTTVSNATGAVQVNDPGAEARKGRFYRVLVP
jgi:hypothetical protein